MKRLYTTLLIILICTSALFSGSWQVGEYVDDFDDPCGVYYGYCICDNALISTEILENEPVLLKLICDVTINPVSLAYRMEVYEQENGREIQDANAGEWKFKDSQNKVFSIPVLGYCWNELSGSGATDLTKALFEGESLKGIFKSKQLEISFSTSSDNFQEVVDELRELANLTGSQKLNVWEIKEYENPYDYYSTFFYDIYLPVEKSDKILNLSFIRNKNYTVKPAVDVSLYESINELLCKNNDIIFTEIDLQCGDSFAIIPMLKPKKYASILGFSFNTKMQEYELFSIDDFCKAGNVLIITLVGKDGETFTSSIETDEFLENYTSVLY